MIRPDAVAARITELEFTRARLCAHFAAIPDRKDHHTARIAAAEGVNNWDCSRQGAELNALRALLAVLTA
jgi:hypothetical protein